MYVRLGQVPSIVTPANPTPLNDAVLYPQSSTPFRVRRPGPQPVLPSSYSGVYPYPQPQSIMPTYAPPGQSVVGYDASGNPIYGGSSVAPYNPYAVQPAGETVVGYDASGNPIYGSSTSPAATVTATVSATPGSLTSWLQTGNNGIYAALAAAVLILLLMRRR